jgi:hypothetical protein
MGVGNSDDYMEKKTENYGRLARSGAGIDSMRVKVQTNGPGLHPSEVVVQVETSEGLQNLVVDHRSVDVETDSLEVGSPLARKGDTWLVELPRETMGGNWRVWVNRDALIDDENENKACVA